MKRSSRLVALALVGFCLLALGTTTADEQPTDPPIPPLWEPSWSPVGLSTYDHPVAAADIDLGGDGTKESIVLGLRYLYRAVPIEDRCELRALNLGDRFRDRDSALAANCMDVGDVNGDGLEDLVVGTKGYKLWVFLQQADGRDFEATTEEPIDVPEEFNHIWLLDHTGDGNLDLMIPDRAGKKGWLTVYKGDGIGTFSPLQQVGGIDEITRDGEVDGFSDEPGLWITTHLGVWFVPRGSYVAEERITFGGKGIAVADFDGDGDADVAISAISLRVYWREDGDYSEERHEIDSVSYWLDHGDLDGDGDEDLVSWAYGPLHIVTLYNEVDSFLEGGIYSTAYMSLQETLTGGNCLDIDHDGAVEILTHSFHGRVGVFTSTPGGSSPQLAPGPFLLGEMDVTGDGEWEILTETYAGHLAYLRDTGLGLFETVEIPVDHADVEFPDTWASQFVIPADLDGDGTQEMILWAADSYGGTFLSGWEKNNEIWTASWLSQIHGNLAPRPIATDLDEDGKDELVVGDGMHFGVHKLIDDVLVQTDRIAWGDDVAPYALAQLPWGERVIGFRSTYESSDLLWLEGNEVRDTGVFFDSLSPLDLIATDLDTDGIDELVFVALGVGLVDDQPYLTMFLGLLDVDASGDWAVSGPWEMPNWPAESIVYPYEGLSAVADRDGMTSIVLSFGPGQRTNGGIGWVTFPDYESAPLTIDYDWLAGGPILLASPLERTTYLLSVTSTDPQVLRVIEVFP